MLTLRVHSVLAGVTTHASSGDGSLCKRWREHELSDIDEPGEPDCHDCRILFAVMLAFHQAERALFNCGDCRPNMTESDLERGPR